MPFTEIYTLRSRHITSYGSNKAEWMQANGSVIDDDMSL